jgi:hypothetical protein
VTFTIDELAEAVRADDMPLVSRILDAQPDLVRTDMAYENEHQLLHYAVYNRLPEMTRLLMQRGADARKGVLPHRVATTALVIAQDRGYDEIVAIVEEEENLRTAGARTDPQIALQRDLMKAFDRNDEGGILRLIEAHPSLIETHRRPLHAAACKAMERLAGWLVDRGYNVNGEHGEDWKPLDMAGRMCAVLLAGARAKNSNVASATWG